MYLIVLLKVLCSNLITIREGMDFDNTGEVTDVIFFGLQDDIPEDLNFSIVQAIQPGNNGCLDVVITR